MRYFLFLTFAMLLPAQDFRATLNGTVLDSSGASVPKARIEVRNSETGVVARTETTGNGEFSVLFLSPGTYSVSAEAPGFKRTVRHHLVLRAGETPGITLTLQPGEVT